jgi:hypothetical protein
MSVKKQLKNPLVQQYVLEILLPLVGYFFFGWSITIIAAFYLIDYFSAEIARNRRVYKVFKASNENPLSFFVLSLVVGIILFVAVVWWVWLMLLWHNFDYEQEMTTELITFAKEELWLLLPVVYLVYHFKDTLTFYMPRKFLSYHFQKMVKYQMLELVILAILVFVGSFFWNYLGLDDISALISFVVIKIGYDILVIRKLDSKYIQK